jgi:hypothetical protein
MNVTLTSALKSWLAVTAFAVGAAGAISSAARAQEPTRAEAESMAEKIVRVMDAAEDPRPASAPPLRTTFTEREINAYLEFVGPDILPAGIAEPRVQLGDGNRIRARAVVDLDAVGRSRERSVFDPLSYLAGSVEVVATGRFETRDGSGLIRYESATVGGVSVPQTVAQELLRFYTRTPERPRGFAFDEPFALPEGMRGVSVERGAVTVTQ